MAMGNSNSLRQQREKQEKNTRTRQMCDAKCSEAEDHDCFIRSIHAKSMHINIEKECLIHRVVYEYVDIPFPAVCYILIS